MKRFNLGLAPLALLFVLLLTPQSAWGVNLVKSLENSYDSVTEKAKITSIDIVGYDIAACNGAPEFRHIGKDGANTGLVTFNLRSKLPECGKYSVTSSRDTGIVTLRLNMDLYADGRKVYVLAKFTKLIFYTNNNVTRSEEDADKNRVGLFGLDGRGDFCMYTNDKWYSYQNGTTGTPNPYMCRATVVADVEYDVHYADNNASVDEPYLLKLQISDLDMNVTHATMWTQHEGWTPFNGFYDDIYLYKESLIGQHQLTPEESWPTYFFSGPHVTNPPSDWGGYQGLDSYTKVGLQAFAKSSTFSCRYVYTLCGTSSGLAPAWKSATYHLNEGTSDATSWKVDIPQLTDYYVDSASGSKGDAMRQRALSLLSADTLASQVSPWHQSYAYTRWGGMHTYGGACGENTRSGDWKNHDYYAYTTIRTYWKCDGQVADTVELRTGQAFTPADIGAEIAAADSFKSAHPTSLALDGWYLEGGFSRLGSAERHTAGICSLTYNAYTQHRLTLYRDFAACAARGLDPTVSVIEARYGEEVALPSPAIASRQGCSGTTAWYYDLGCAGTQAPPTITLTKDAALYCRNLCTVSFALTERAKELDRAEATFGVDGMPVSLAALVPDGKTLFWGEAYSAKRLPAITWTQGFDIRQSQGSYTSDAAGANVIGTAISSRTVTADEVAYLDWSRPTFDGHVGT